MARLSSKLRSLVGGLGHEQWTGIGFWCPGCEHFHQFCLTQSDGSAMWSWDGNAEAPTVTPSLLIYANSGTPRCHLVLTRGELLFQVDCDHALRGQTVPLPDWPYAEGEYGGV